MGRLTLRVAAASEGEGRALALEIARALAALTSAPSAPALAGEGPVTLGGVHLRVPAGSRDALAADVAARVAAHVARASRGEPPR
ncbi:MAG: hypothetical protein KF901_27995 [Myxococcales bacterium]|nr:hypothetical protein [Myxococcales bacterium]